MGGGGGGQQVGCSNKVYKFMVDMLHRPHFQTSSPNRLANQSQILCGASLGRGNESLFAASGSHDQDGRHAHIW